MNQVFWRTGIEEPAIKGAPIKGASIEAAPIKGASIEVASIKGASIEGWRDGFVGMAIFAGSLPATRVAVVDFDPYFLTFARAALAGLLALSALGAVDFVYGRPRPAGREWASVCLVSICVVLAFPLLSALALRQSAAAHALAFVGLLPLTTACFSVWRGAATPAWPFWLFSIAGALLVLTFALKDARIASHGGGTAFGDVCMLAAVAICGLGYAEGGKLAQKIGGWRTISWALVVAWPIVSLCALFWAPADFSRISAPAWLGLAYVSIFSMFVGFVFWYRGLARGGVAAVGQLQLLQPFLGLAVAAALLGETLSWPLLLTSVGVAGCVFGARFFAPPPTVSDATSFAAIGQKHVNNSQMP